MRPNNRDSILRAAEEVILENGVGSLTLDEVASRAEMSKGGLLYHFKTKDELVEQLLVFAFANFEASVERLALTDQGSGSWLRSYVRATFDRNAVTEAESLASAALIVAYFGKDSAVRQLYEEAHARWSERARHDGIGPATADVVRMATDGLWLAEALGVSRFARARKQAFVNKLLDLTR